MSTLYENDQAGGANAGCSPWESIMFLAISPTHTVKQLKLKNSNDSYTGSADISIRATTGSPPYPTGPDLGSYGTITIGPLDNTWYTSSVLTSPVGLTIGNVYAIILHKTSVNWAMECTYPTAPYKRYNSSDGTTWNYATDWGWEYQIWGDPYVPPTTYTKDYSIDMLIEKLGLTKTDSIDTRIKNLNVTRTDNTDVLLRKLGLTKNDNIDALFRKLGLIKTDNIDTLIIRIGFKSDNLDVALRKLGLLKTDNIDVLLERLGLIRTNTIDVLIEMLNLTKSDFIDFIIKGALINKNIDVDLLKYGTTKSKTIETILDNFQLKGRMNAAKESLISKIQTYDPTLTVIDSWRLNKWDFNAFTSNLVSIKIMPSRMNRLSYGSMITENYFGQYYSYRFTLHVLARYDETQTIHAKTAMDIANGIVKYLRINQQDTNKGVLSILDITARESDPSGMTRGGAYMGRIIIDGLMFCERPYKYKYEVI